MHVKTVSIIGSFKQHYAHIQMIVNRLREAGIELGSPLGDSVIRENIPFVRFESDDISHSDQQVQTEALNRIFRSELTYVADVGGYVGRTTCYEIGRIIQNRKPLYFQQAPIDLPIYIPPSHILSIDQLLELMIQDSFLPSPLYQDEDDNLQRGEIALLK